LKEIIKYLLTVAISIMVATVFMACDSKEAESFDQAFMTSSGQDISKGVSECTTESRENAQYSNSQLNSEEGKDTDNFICVYVCGAVNAPDVYTLDPNARIADAVKIAGGLREDAGEEYINLASRLSDGQKIYVPTKEEVMNALENGEEYIGSVVNITSNGSGMNQTGSGNQVYQNKTDTRVNINTAGVEELKTIPGVGDSKANKIIEYRNINGRFNTIEDIMLIAGIKDGMFNKIKDYICVD